MLCDSHNAHVSTATPFPLLQFFKERQLGHFRILTGVLLQNSRKTYVLTGVLLQTLRKTYVLTGVLLKTLRKTYVSTGVLLKTLRKT